MFSLFFALNSSEPSIIDNFTYTIGAPNQRASHQRLTFKYFRSLKKNDVKLDFDI